MKNNIFPLLALGACSLHASESPNIIFFLVDDLGWMDVGYNGSDFYYTPTIDSLASSGMIFNQAYAMPTSSPSRASYMSGLFQPNTGIYAVDAFAGTPERMKKLIRYRSKKILDRSIPTIAELLNKAGYTTCHIGKWHLGNDPLSYPLMRGFDYNVAGCEAGSPKSYYPPFPGVKFVTPKEGDNYLINRLTDEAVDFIEGYSSDEPFFLNMCFYAVHVPVELYKPDLAIVRDRKPEFGRKNYDYAAMVYTVDRSINRILTALHEKGLDRNTLIIFTSDNGGQLMVTDNHPLKGQKGNIYEGGIRVPTFITWDGVVSKGSMNNTPISIVDYFPTMASVAGISPSDYEVDGKDLSGLITGKESLTDRSIFWHLPNYTGKGTNAKVWQTPVSAIRKGKWKLIKFYEEKKVELYNIDEDKSEETELSSVYPEITSKLKKELEDWVIKTEAPIPSKTNKKYVKESRSWIIK